MALKEDVRSLFYHGFDSYMEHAFPEDELQPLSCRGSGSDRTNPDNLGINDVCGDYALTLIDSLSMLPILGDQLRFERAIHDVLDTVTFDVDSKVQIFEVTIRVLGGLLSAHQSAKSPILNATVEWYQDELLDLALDLGRRLLPAFETPTGIPFPRINLRYGMQGIPSNSSTVTCAAGAGSLLLEFALLSRLSGIDSFENVARRAFEAIWDRRLDLGLVGNTIDVNSGLWTSSYTSIGAGIDSFYEYALKAWVFLGDRFYYDVWNESQKAIEEFVADNEGYVYRNIHVKNGIVLSNYIDSLSAYYPGLLVLAGDTEAAIKSHLVYQALWTRFAALPERFNIFSKEVEIPWYPLRPEFVESTYHLYRATKDPFYLAVGLQILDDLKSLRQPCGFAGLGNVLTRVLDDRMESFMLSETLKYLYLLFDEAHQLNSIDSNWVFTTEGHPIFLDRRRSKANPMGQRAFADHERCAPIPSVDFYSGVMSRQDFSRARFKGLTNADSIILPPHFPDPRPLAISAAQWSEPDFEVLFGSVSSNLLNGSQTLPLLGQIYTQVRRLKFTFSRVGSEYFATRVNQIKVGHDASITIQDPVFDIYTTDDLLRFSEEEITSQIGVMTPDGTEQMISGTCSLHGSALPEQWLTLNVISLLDTTNSYGCDCPAIFRPTWKPESTAIIVNRGQCSFYEKCMNSHGLARLIIVLDKYQESRMTRPTLIDSSGMTMPNDQGFPSLLLVGGNKRALMLSKAQQIRVSSRSNTKSGMKLIVRGDVVSNVAIEPL